jgi:hypothetical protein
MALGEGAVPAADRSSGVAVTAPPPLPVAANRMGSAPASTRRAARWQCRSVSQLGCDREFDRNPGRFRRCRKSRRCRSLPKFREKRRPPEVIEAHLPLLPPLQDADPCLAGACRNTKDRAGQPSRHIQRSPKLRRSCKSAGTPSRPALPDRDAPGTLGPRALRDALVRRDARTRRPA